MSAFRARPAVTQHRADEAAIGHHVAFHDFAMHLHRRRECIEHVGRGAVRQALNESHCAGAQLQRIQPRLIAQDVAVMRDARRIRDQRRYCACPMPKPRVYQARPTHRDGGHAACGAIAGTPIRAGPGHQRGDG